MENNNIYHFISEPFPSGRNYTAEITATDFKQACLVYFNAIVKGKALSITSGTSIQIRYYTQYGYEMNIIFTPIAGCNNVYSIDFKSPRQ